MASDLPRQLTTCSTKPAPALARESFRQFLLGVTESVASSAPRCLPKSLRADSPCVNLCQGTSSRRPAAPQQLVMLCFDTQPIRLSLAQIRAKAPLAGCVARVCESHARQRGQDHPPSRTTPVETSLQDKIPGSLIGTLNRISDPSPP